VASAPRRKEGPKAPPDRDYQEERALARAVEAAKRFSPGINDAAIAVAISEWILSRTSMLASVRLNQKLLFDFKDARLRGFVEAALPSIGDSLGHLPPDVPFFELTPDQVIDVFVAGILGAQGAAVAANESLGFPFDDEIPFGDAR
jgi:hypothetical protein